MSVLLSANILEVFGLDWVSMLIYLGNLVLLIVVLVLVLYRPVRNMLRDKRKNLDDVYRENERLKEESASLRAQYDKMVDEMKLENAKEIGRAHV